MNSNFLTDLSGKKDHPTINPGEGRTEHAMSTVANSSQFANKNVVVTGGASGIGLAITRAFATVGAHVLVLDLDEKQWQSIREDLNNLAGKAEFIRCDISRFDQVAAIADRIPKTLHALVNNAGISHIGKLGDTTEMELDRLYQVNVKGLFNVTHACLEKLADCGAGAIVNLSSIAAQVGLSDRFAYSMSKGAVTAMTRSIARDYLDSGIRCNAISPARVHTPFVDNFLAENYPGREQEMFEALSQSQPVGRMGKPDEIASLTLYLCSEEAAFITGSDFSIDGGFTGLKT